MSYTGTLVKTGQGTGLTVCTTSGGTFVAVGEITGDLGFEVTALFEDATNQQSAGKEQIAVFSDYPKCPLEMNNIPTDAGQLILEIAALANPPAKLFFKLQKPIMGAQTTTGDLYTFAANIKSWKESDPTNKKATRKADLEITNGITKVVGS